VAAQWLRPLPNGKLVSALGFGCSSLWAKPEFGEVDAQAILRSAVADGINHFDTSPSYGLGTGEQRLGRFLAEHGRDGLVISTKVGNNVFDDKVRHGFSRELMVRSFDASLKRLGVDRVDLLYLHGPSLAELDNPDVVQFFEAQKQAGRITYAGVESQSAEVIARVADTPFDAVMAHFNVAQKALADDIRRLCNAGKIVMSGTTLAQMKFDIRRFLPTNRHALWYLLRMAKNDPLFWWRAPALARQLRASGKTPRQAAIEFVVTHPHITSGLFGSANAEHVAANARTGRELAKGVGRDQPPG
jgi:D-threo-aldose 1-dehydrogenase